jgi:hypothetical protein
MDSRQRVQEAQFDASPEQLVRGPPNVHRLPVGVWINRAYETQRQMPNVDDETPASTSRAPNQATVARPSAAGSPAQGRAALAEEWRKTLWTIRPSRDAFHC